MMANKHGVCTSRNEDEDHSCEVVVQVNKWSCARTSMVCMAWMVHTNNTTNLWMNHFKSKLRATESTLTLTNLALTFHQPLQQTKQEAASPQTSPKPTSIKLPQRCAISCQTTRKFKRHHTKSATISSNLRQPWSTMHVTSQFINQTWSSTPCPKTLGLTWTGRFPHWAWHTESQLQTSLWQAMHKSNPMLKSVHTQSSKDKTQLTAMWVRAHERRQRQKQLFSSRSKQGLCNGAPCETKFQIKSMPQMPQVTSSQLGCMTMKACVCWHFDPSLWGYKRPFFYSHLFTTFLGTFQVQANLHI